MNNKNIFKNKKNYSSIIMGILCTSSYSNEMPKINQKKKWFIGNSLETRVTDYYTPHEERNVIKKNPLKTKE